MEALIRPDKLKFVGHLVISVNLWSIWLGQNGI
jgi:hypothetical protein